ncbi:hypothetical protein H2198_004947 [Neophaeococcomyces mojaviensis]|uniref:Uncharacterized protein n=1 Tax=Neophaeococcomyces mojaviensis TaxID=3383035 RepID=A0ACC3A7Z3_9EURO|nr:hypothetical protein H2198_004947 [Knufia sp. JES_112]
MPRNRAVDYPQVPHRPTTTVQSQLGLAPPPSFTSGNRFSFQETPTEAVSPNADHLFEAANAARRQQQKEQGQWRQSTVPPLPILPEHLSDGQTQSTQQELLPSQKRDWALAQAQQEQHQQPQPHNRGPTPTYEQSQYTYQHPQQYQPRMQEQPVYLGPYNGQDTQLSAHVFPIQNDRQVPTIEDAQQPEERKIPLPEATHRPNSPQQSQQSKPVHIGPDENPLSPMSPRSVTFPTTTTNIHIVPSVPLPAATMAFPQSTSYAQQQPARGGTWHHSLYSCADPTTCLSSLFCPCLVYGRTQHRLNLKSGGKDPTNMLGYSSVNASCIAWAVLPGVNALLTAIQHRRVRKAYDMEGKGDFVGDCVRGVCCCCCMLAQDEKEMKHRDVPIAKKMEGEGYQRTEGMRFAPPRG